MRGRRRSIAQAIADTRMACADRTEDRFYSISSAIDQVGSPKRMPIRSEATPAAGVIPTRSLVDLGGQAASAGTCADGE